MKTTDTIITRLLLSACVFTYAVVAEDKPANPTGLRATLALASDLQRPDEERRHAIDELGRLAQHGSPEALGFLVTNVSLRLPMPKIKGDEDMLKETPCVYALFVHCRSNLPLAKTLVAGVPTTASTADVTRVAFVLRHMVGRQPATRLVEEALTNKPAADRAQKLALLKSRLTE
jgi:hypothetical protein